VAYINIEGVRGCLSLYTNLNLYGDFTMEEKLIVRETHCDFAVLNTDDKCIASCGHNWRTFFEYDCTGAEGETPEHLFEKDGIRREL
jgi:hypothetical protein